MSSEEFPTTEENQEVQAVSDLLPGHETLTIHPYSCKVDADGNYRVECWHAGDTQPLWTKQGIQTLDGAMLQGLMQLKIIVTGISEAIQSEIDKRTP